MHSTFAFYQADGIMYNSRVLTTHYLIDCCDIENWGAHSSPLGFFGYTDVDLNPISIFFWGENYYNIAVRGETEWSTSQKGSGIGKIEYSSIRAIDSFSDGALVILEGDPEYTIEKWVITPSAAFKFGTGGKGDADDLLNHPRDVTVDNEDYVYVLDILSNGQPRIKVFDDKLKPVKGIGDSTLIPETPISCDWDNYNNALHILHSQGVTVIYKQ